MTHAKPPASGTVYCPRGPRVELPPTNTMEQIEIRVVKANIGYAPDR